MDLYEIDVTGDDLLKKGYGIIVLYNNKYAYGYRLPSDLQKNIRKYHNEGRYGLKTTKILKPRAYCAILINILIKISTEHQTETSQFKLNICNDFDGHKSDIIQILRNETKIKMIFEEITADNYSFVKHPKKSKIQKYALRLYRGESDNLTKLKIDKEKIHDIIAKPKFKKEKW